MSAKLSKENKDIDNLSTQSEQQPEIEKTAQTSSVLQSESAIEYDQLKAYREKVNRLSNQVLVASSTKAALDINSKLLVEIAYLQIEMIHMQAIANQAVSWRMQHDLKVAASTEAFLGDEGGQS